MEQQHAAEAAGHEYMEVVDKKFDDVSKINEEHFEMATSEARCSLSGTQAGRDRSFSASQGQGTYGSGIGDPTARTSTHRKLLGERLPGVGERER